MADEKKPDLSPNLARLAEAIRADRRPVRTALCGFDLWLEALSSPHIARREMTWGGGFVPPEPPPETLKVGVPVLGGRIVVSLDPSLPPDAFELRA